MGPTRELPTDVPEATLAYILFTSGTTSRPKGVEITHRNLAAQMETFVRQYGLDATSRLLNVPNPPSAAQRLTSFCSSRAGR